MTLGEIARCLFKKNWADHTEYKAALAAYGRLSPKDQQIVEDKGKGIC